MQTYLEALLVYVELALLAVEDALRLGRRSSKVLLLNLHLKNRFLELCLYAWKPQYLGQDNKGMHAYRHPGPQGTNKHATVFFYVLPRRQHIKKTCIKV